MQSFRPTESDVLSFSHIAVCEAAPPDFVRLFYAVINSQVQPSAWRTVCARAQTRHTQNYKRMTLSLRVCVCAMCTTPFRHEDVIFSLFLTHFILLLLLIFIILRHRRRRRRGRRCRNPRPSSHAHHLAYYYDIYVSKGFLHMWIVFLVVLHFSFDFFILFYCVFIAFVSVVARACVSMACGRAINTENTHRRNSVSSIVYIFHHFDWCI